MKHLVAVFDSLESLPFRKIRQVQGKYRIDLCDLTFLRVQASPGAHPASIGELSFVPEQAGLPGHHLGSFEGNLALSDFLIRRFHEGIKRFAHQNRGADGSGSFHTIDLGQKILERDSVIVSINCIRLRFMVSFPSKSKGGGSFDSCQAKIMFQQELIQIARYCFVYSEYDEQTRQALDDHIRVIQDRKKIHCFLSQNQCIAFIPDNAVLARASGIDDRPLKADTIKLFHSPETLAVTIPVTDNCQIRGMAIKEGITIITGGGFTGKSTLLQAIESGIYPHIPGDGRERIVTRSDAVCVQAEQGRNIEKVNISPFITHLPGNASVAEFSTPNASGSTSQAAGIMEALEAGSKLLLFDEDTCATNLLVHDHLIQKIIPPDQEPITPLYSVVRSMWEKYGISIVLVIGGLGIFLQKADLVLAMDAFECKDSTDLVRNRLGPMATEEPMEFTLPCPRVLGKNNFNPSYTNLRLNKTVPCRIKPLRNDPKKLEYGIDLIDLSFVHQIVEPPQTMAIGLFIRELKKYLDAETYTGESLTALINRLYSRVETNNCLALDHDYPGTVSLPRKFELAAAVNRLRSLHIRGQSNIATSKSSLQGCGSQADVIPDD